MTAGSAPQSTLESTSNHVRVGRVLCPVDLSEPSQQALRHARVIAARHHASLTVLEVVWLGLPPITYPGSGMSGSEVPVLSPADRDALFAELSAFSQLEADPAVTPDVRIGEGPVVPGILRVARELPADLIVLGTHGRSGFDRLLLGSVADKVLRKAPCPVLTVPPHESRQGAPGRYQTIVCAVDFSPASLAGLRYAASLAHDTSGRLVLLHALDWLTEPLGKAPPDLKTDVHERAMRASIAASLRAALLEALREPCSSEEVVNVGRPHEEIVRLAESRNADLIVIGVHGRSSLDLAFFGSTTSQVIRHATCPVLTVRG